MRRRSVQFIVLATMLGMPVTLQVMGSPSPAAAADIERCPAGSTNLSGTCFVTLTASGTWTAPPYVNSVVVRAVGGGGGGGAAGGGGGGGGQVTTCTNTTVTPGANYPVIVGAGGLGGQYDVLFNYAGADGGGSSAIGCVASGGFGGDPTGGMGGASGNGNSGGLGTGAAGTGRGGGGGGAGGGGATYDFFNCNGASGGIGVNYNSDGSGGYGGGGGGGWNCVIGSSVVSAGGGAGGNGISAGSPGTANTGGGGGGGGTGANVGGKGGSGVVIIGFAAWTESDGSITVSATTDTKTYDGTTTSDEAPTVAVGSLFPGDTISAASCPQEFDSPNAGSRTLTVNDGCTIFDSSDNDVTSYYTITLGDTANGTIERAKANCGSTPTYTGDPVVIVCRGIDGQPLGTTTVIPNAPTNEGDWESAGPHTITYDFSDESGNYEVVDEGTVEITIAKAEPVCTVTGYSVSFDGTPHSATGTCIGVKGEVLVGLDLSATTYTDIGTYDDLPWTFTDVTGNYNDTEGEVDGEIGKSQAMVTYVDFQRLRRSTPLALEATVTPDWCDAEVTYTITPDPLTGTGSMTVTGSSVSTEDWRTGTKYTVTATYDEDDNCLEHSDSGELLVVSRTLAVLENYVTSNAELPTVR